MKISLERIVSPPPMAPLPPSLSAPSSMRTLASEVVDYSDYKSTFVSSTNNSTMNNSKSSNMRLLQVHPSLPYVAYCLEAPKPSQRQIVVQNYLKGCRDILFSITMADLAAAVYEYDVHTPDGSLKQDSAIRSLGTILNLDFFDPASLFHSGLTTHDSMETPSPLEKRWQGLLVQFNRRVIVLNLRMGPNSRSMAKDRRLYVSPSQTTSSPSANNSSNHTFSFHPILFQITENTLSKNAAPSTTGLPITPALFVFGCLDGSIRIYNWKKEIVVKSAKGPLEKNDAIVDLKATHSSEKEDAQQQQQQQQQRRSIRFLALTRKGIAYLWEVVLEGTATVVEIRPPLIRFIGYQYETTTRVGVGSNNGISFDTISSPTNSAGPGGSGNDDSYMEHQLVEYDRERDLLLWFVPSGYNGSSKAHVLVWNLAAVPEHKNKKSVVVPKMDPFLVMWVPKEFTELGITSLTGWMHPSFPMDVLTCALVAPNGDFHVLSCPLGNRTSARSVKENEPIPFFGASLSELAQMVAPTRLSVYSLAYPRISDTSTVLVNTNIGLLVLTLEDDCDVKGSLHMHLGSDIEKGGNSILRVEHSSVFWSRLNVGGPNPIGHVPVKDSSLVYESPVPPHLPFDIQKRSVRLSPVFLRSPSSKFVCLFWPDELRYEILHLETLLQRRNTIGSRTSDAYSPAVASGTNILSFAWVGDDDNFALLHPPTTEDFRMDSTSIIDTTPTAQSSMAETPGVSKKKRFNFNKLEKFRPKSVITIGTPSNAGMATSVTSPVSSSPDMGGSRTTGGPSARSNSWVELKTLVEVSANATEFGGSVAAATARALGELSLRGGPTRNHPTTLFGGPVLCVGCGEEDDGTAHFYSRNESDDKDGAAAYTSSGPALPYPDFVEWDADGRLCAVVVESRVTIYLSDPPNFLLLGSVRIGSAMEPVAVTSVKFLHGVLYCTTKTAVQCIFLGDLEREDSLCHLDSFIIASKDVPSLPVASSGSDAPQGYSSWTPRTTSMALNHPQILGYQSGSLLVSTVTGVKAVSLDNPLLRIGSLIAAGETEGAQQWFEAVPDTDHEALAAFLDRRGLPELALQLAGLSMETFVEYCMKHGFVDQLVETIEHEGIEKIRRISMGPPNGGLGYNKEEHHQSMVLNVGTYLLSQGKVDFVKLLAQDCLESGTKEGQKEAFALASLLMSVDASDAQNMIKQTVSDADENSWPVGAYYRDHVL